jgi:DNA invertase Pin-like site-specific DNA recombinase
MRIGYGRVSTRDQNPNAQHDALSAAGCEQIFVDKASGKLARRPELDKALLVAHRPGDQLVVTKLDRLGRSLEHLIDLSVQLQERGVDLVVLDQKIDTSGFVGERQSHRLVGSRAGRLVAKFVSVSSRATALPCGTRVQHEAAPCHC